MNLIYFKNNFDYLRYLSNEIFTMEYSLNNNISLTGYDMALLPNRLRSFKKEYNSLLNKLKCPVNKNNLK